MGSGGPEPGQPCSAWFEKYGYFVGCSKPSGSQVKYGPSADWYSFPGSCPSLDYNHKTDQCRKQFPGGQCQDPDGSPECVWKVESNSSVAGETEEFILIDDLADTKPNYHEWCKAGGCEYDKAMDSGTTGFWNRFIDPNMNAKRVDALLAAFKKKYPKSEDLPDPGCVAF